MANYFIEFAIINLLLFAVYKVLLRKETQVSLLRGFLITATFLALILPLINIPISSSIQPINLAESVSSILLQEVSVTAVNIAPPWYSTINWLNWLYFLISILVSMRFMVALSRILLLYRKSEPYQIYDRTVRNYEGLDSIFTFFSWIFIDKSHPENAKDIVLHEEAHIKFGHSYDLMFLNILAIPFWWVPTIWLTIKELKQLHEYQADEYAIRYNSYKNYARTLINYNLSKQGLTLTNSFNDTPLTKRLSFMKQLKKNISPWKVAGVLLMLTLTVYTFSCQEMTTTELEDKLIGEKIDALDDVYQEVDIMPAFAGGKVEFYNYLSSTIKYTDEALKAKVSGKIFVEFVVDIDGSVSSTKILKGLGYGLDEEAKQIVANSPTWIPGEHKGNKVKVKMVLPITYRHPDYVELDGQGSEAVKDLPSYPGGKMELFKYVQENLKYPEEAKNAGIEGKVFIEFMVNTDGSISNVNVKRGIGSGCDEEARRIVENSPYWTPMKVDGEARSMTMVLPITFKLE